MSLLDEAEDASGDGGPLDGKRCHQHVEGNAAETIATKEGHKEPKTNEDHHVDILKDCGERKVKISHSHKKT